MRVDLYIEHYPNPYKPWIDAQIVQLMRAGHDVRIFAEAAFTSTIHDEVRTWRLQSRTSYYPATMRWLRRDGGRALRMFVTHLPSQTPRVLAAIAGAGSLKHRLLVGTRVALLPVDAPDVCYIHNLVTAARLTFLRRLYPESRLCMYFHGGEVGGQPKVEREETVFGAMHAVVTSTRFAAEQAVARGCDPAKIAIVPLGFDLPSYRPAVPRNYRPDGILRFISVGRMSPEKGFLHALQAAQRLRDSGQTSFTYTLVGSGIQYSALRHWAREHGLDDVVRFVGEKTRAEVAAALEAADVFILPSVVTDVWAETQATVVQEAMLMGCVVLATTTGGVPESTAPAMHGFMVPPGDPEALAAQMDRLIGLGTTELADLGQAGRAFAVQGYDIAPLMERILAHANGALDANDRARYLQPRSS